MHVLLKCIPAKIQQQLLPPKSASKFQRNVLIIYRRHANIVSDKRNKKAINIIFTGINCDIICVYHKEPVEHFQIFDLNFPKRVLLLYGGSLNPSRHSYASYTHT
jgi:hypothetical protein